MGWFVICSISFYSSNSFQTLKTKTEGQTRFGELSHIIFLKEYKDIITNKWVIYCLTNIVYYILQLEW